MIIEVTPLPQMFLFFALFSIVGKTSAFIGPLVSSAIITASGNNDNMSFAFLFTLCAISISQNFNEMLTGGDEFKGEV